MGDAYQRLVAAVTVAALLASCATHNEVRRSVEVQHYNLDWSGTDVPVVQIGALQARGLVLAPAQWPLESSVKRLIQGDLGGIVDAASFRFRPSQVPDGVFEDLYAYGLVAVYIRIVNPTLRHQAFDPLRFALRDRYGVTSPAASRGSLPSRFPRIDWGKSAKQAASAAGDVALTVVVLVTIGAVVVLLGGRPGDVGPAINAWGGRGVPNRPAGPLAPAEPPYQPLTVADPGADSGILVPGNLPARSYMEGVVFFVREPLTDWSTTELVAN